MKYYNTQNVLPEEVIEIIQKYVDGGYIYIPKKDNEHKAWGENNGTKNSFRVRNIEIYNKHIAGVSVIQLAKEYYLSEQSIRRIINQEKTLCSISKQNHL